MRDVIALCRYVPWLQEGGQVRLVGSASMDGFVSQLILSTLNYDARSTTHQSTFLFIRKYSISILITTAVRNLNLATAQYLLLFCLKEHTTIRI